MSVNDEKNEDITKFKNKKWISIFEKLENKKKK